MPSSTVTATLDRRQTFRVAVTLEVRAADEQRALRLARHAIVTTAHARRASDEITHAWISTRAERQFCEQAGCPVEQCVHCQIAAAVEYGHEDEARRRFGDATVDDWFRAEWDVDPDAMRDERVAHDDREFDARREDGR